MRDAFPDVPVVACTGTGKTSTLHFTLHLLHFPCRSSSIFKPILNEATAKVIKDIRDTLKLEATVPCIMGTFNRQNVSYEGKSEFVSTRLCVFIYNPSVANPHLCTIYSMQFDSKIH